MARRSRALNSVTLAHLLVNLSVHRLVYLSIQMVSRWFQSNRSTLTTCPSMFPYRWLSCIISSAVLCSLEGIVVPTSHVCFIFSHVSRLLLPDLRAYQYVHTCPIYARNIAYKLDGNVCMRGIVSRVVPSAFANRVVRCSNCRIISQVGCV